MQRAQRAVGEPVGEEVQVVEDDELAEPERRIGRAADGDGEHRARPELLQRDDVGLVRDLAREALVVVAVARDVQDVLAGEAPAG